MATIVCVADCGTWRELCRRRLIERMTPVGKKNAGVLDFEERTQGRDNRVGDADEVSVGIRARKENCMRLLAGLTCRACRR